MVTSIELLGGRALDFRNNCLIMGILNCTPDSFYRGSRNDSPSQALAAARKMLENGADIIDIGGESTRPGSTSTDAHTELRRVIPVIEELRRFTSIPISIDTRKSAVAKAAVRAGADIINDISALTDDPDLGPYAAKQDIPVILMHKRGTPKTMQENPRFDDAAKEVRDELGAFAERAMAMGVRKERIIIDPGIGFGKRIEDNFSILNEIQSFMELDFPVLAGVSRKSFIGKVLSDPTLGERAAEDRLSGTLGVHAWCMLRGVHILRVHDVRETADVRAVLKAIQTRGGNL